eukprot:COSAG03_NODE_341_length_8828_cov_77.724940_12_plen_189_part_00
MSERQRARVRQTARQRVRQRDRDDRWHASIATSTDCPNALTLESGVVRIATIDHRARVDHSAHRDAFLSDEHQKVVDEVRANHPHAALRSRAAERNPAGNVGHNCLAAAPGCRSDRTKRTDGHTTSADVSCPRSPAAMAACSLRCTFSQRRLWLMTSLTRSGKQRDTRPASVTHGTRRCGQSSTHREM